MITVPVLKPQVSQNFVGLPLDLSGLAIPEHLGMTYVRKSEFHVTLIGSGHKFHSRFANARGDASMECRSDAIRSCECALHGLRFQVSIEPKFYRVEKVYEMPKKHKRISIIATCNVDGVQEFYRRLAELARVPIEPPPFHVTLYTYDDEMSRKGIGIISQNEFVSQAVDITKSHFGRILRSHIL